MTLSPSDDRRTEGIDGPVYELNQVCPVPGCGTGVRLQRHHMFRRSDVIGDHWWVRTKDGWIYGNCVNICSYHHRELTENISRIILDDGIFYWKDVLFDPIPLLWQPPPEQEVINEKRDLKPPEKKESHVPHSHDQPHEPDFCPTCLRKLPRPKDENNGPEPKKVRKTYSVAVPMDLWENGAEVIDTLLEESRVELARNGWPYGDGKVVKYYVLTAALGMFVTHAASLMSDE